jgi:hypothetical protein
MAYYKKMLERYNTFNGLLKIIEKEEAKQKYPALIPIGEALRKKIDKINTLQWSRTYIKNS